MTTPSEKRLEGLQERLEELFSDESRLKFLLVKFASKSEYRRVMSAPFFRSNGMRGSFPFAAGNFRWAGGVVSRLIRPLHRDESNVPSVRATHAWISRRQGPCEIGFLIGPSAQIQRYFKVAAEAAQLLKIGVWNVLPCLFDGPATLTPKFAQNRRTAVWISYRNAWGKSEGYVTGGARFGGGDYKLAFVVPNVDGVVVEVASKSQQRIPRKRGRPRSEIVMSRSKRLLELKAHHQLSDSDHAELARIARLDRVIKKLARERKLPVKRFVNRGICRDLCRRSKRPDENSTCPTTDA